MGVDSSTLAAAASSGKLVKASAVWTRFGFGDPEGPKYLTYRAFKASILGIVVLVMGRYLIVWYLDPWGQELLLGCRADVWKHCQCSQK